MNAFSSREEDLFAAAVELPPGEQVVFLERECGADLALRARVEGLLRAQAHAGAFLDDPAVGHTLASANLPAGTEPVRIGRYRLLQKIGEGGCGIVYLAEQAEPVRRRVALKVIKLGMDTHEVIARFDVERQALALMDHPNIARVLDAGATDAGRPFFVMELVRGVPITKYCDEHHLGTGERLRLFGDVCRAVQHAHQKGVIHRDLKPSNILVTIHDGAAVPKVIDFGIAKATQGRLTERTLFTSSEQVIGTPAYMSPEQAEFGGVDIDTRSDIYSLGVLLYELLTGRPPFDPKTLAQASLDEVRHLIREVDPPRPSARISSLATADRATVAKLRSTDGGELSTRLRGDLDWIVMKALEKNRARRYETANGLARDLERYLQDEPIVARPPSALYHFRKFARRNRSLCWMATALAFVLVAGATVSLREAIRATRAEREQSRLREQAQTEAARSAQVATFLKDMLKDADSLVALGLDGTLLQRMIELTVARLPRDLRGQAEVEADLREILGTVYLNLGNYRRAEEMFGEALAVRQRLRGNHHPEVARSLNYLGVVLGRLGKLPEAEAKLRGAAALQEALRGTQESALAETLGNLGVVLAQRARVTEAVATIRRALAIQERLFGHESAEVARSLKKLGTVLEQSDQPAEAEQCLRDALAINQKLLGARHPEVASTIHSLGIALVGLGRYTEALELYVQAVAIRQQLPEDAGRSQKNLISALEQQGSLAELDRMLSRTVESMRARCGRDSVQVAYWLAPRAYVLLQERKYAEAEPVARECLAIRQRRQPGDWTAFHAQSLLGGALAGQKRFAAAEAELLSGYEGLLARAATLPAENALRPAEAARRLVELYTDWGRADQAGAWQRKLAVLAAGAKP